MSSSKSRCVCLCLDHCIMLKSAVQKLLMWGGTEWMREKGRESLICFVGWWLRGSAGVTSLMLRMAWLLREKPWAKLRLNPVGAGSDSCALCSQRKGDLNHSWTHPGILIKGSFDCQVRDRLATREAGEWQGTSDRDQRISPSTFTMDP